MMKSDRWQQVEDILQAAIDRPRQERAVYLDEVCSGDDDLKSETASLLRAVDCSGEFMEQPAIARDARVIAEISAHSNIGRIIGPYKIMKQLGAGGMGEVYLAQDARLRRLVALKILPSYFVFDQDRLRRFQREARAASALNHPNIFTIHEVGEFEDVHFIATEFIDGQTLGEVGSTRTLSIKEILDIAVQVASALTAAHAAGIVHRDIKPENIMLRRDGIVKILDFGIAKLTEQAGSEYSSDAPTKVKAQTEAGVVMGTPRYMSPEQARGFAVDEGTDIWSFGVVLYELITQRAPFERPTRVDTLVEILEREPPPLAQFSTLAQGDSQQLQLIIDKALRKARSERYQTAAEMHADLNRLKQVVDLASHQPLITELKVVASESSDSTVQADATTVSTSRPGIGLRRRRLVLTALVVSALLVLISGMILYWRYVSTGMTTAKIAPTETAPTIKLYTQMSESEQLAFIADQEQRVSALMGDRPIKLSDEALRAIKARIDRYVARVGSISDQAGKEDLSVIYARAVPFVPLLKTSFAARKVPVIIGIYLPMIESEFKTCSENQSGSKGLFQFLPQTARAYGVAPEEMCDVDKMTPAAAHYIADRMAELGDDAQSMTLVLLSYNYGAEGVRDALRELRGADNYERNFWTLFANRNRLTERFREEGALYVPSFFAAAIIGENPQTFELQTPALSTLIATGPS